MSETALREIENQIPLECTDQVVPLLATTVTNYIVPTRELSDEALAVETFTNPLASEAEDDDLEDCLEEQAEQGQAATLLSDPDLESKVRRACERISENVHICANEPSLAFYRLSEHVRKALPPTVESRQQVQSIQRQLGAAYEDADVALQEVESMEQAAPLLSSTIEMLKAATLLQQQIKQEQSKRPKKEPSMYQRLSAHLTSVELLSDLREISASRISSCEDANSAAAQQPPAKMTRSESSGINNK